MTQRKDTGMPVLLAFDGAKGMYLPRIREAASSSGWLIDPVNSERYALKDLNDGVDAMTVAISDRGFLTSFGGKMLIEVAKKIKIPTAAISLEERRGAIAQLAPNALFIRKDEDIVEKLSGWLVGLTVRSET